METKRLVVLIAGTGSALQGVLDATRWETLGAEVVAVFSHDRWGYGLLRAEREGVPAILHDLAEFRAEGRGEQAYSEALAERVAAFRPDLVVLAGWQLPLDESFFRHFPDRVINLHPGHPSRFPSFDPYGQNPISRAFDAFNAGLIHETHVTVQILNSVEAYGQVVAQVPVPIYDFDTLVDLEDRMNRAQQELLVNTLRLLLRDNETSPATAYHS